MNALLQREARNSQFDFLRPNHGLFGFFTKLTEQYTKVLAPSPDFKEKFERYGKDKYEVSDLWDVTVAISNQAVDAEKCYGTSGVCSIPRRKEEES
jgi:splicing factor 3A subunit 1